MFINIISSYEFNEIFSHFVSIDEEFIPKKITVVEPEKYILDQDYDKITFIMVE